MAAGEGQLEEFRRAIRAEFTEGDVVETEVLGAGQHVRISFDAAYQLAQDDPIGEDVRALVVPLTP